MFFKIKKTDELFFKTIITTKTTTLKLLPTLYYSEAVKKLRINFLF